MSFQPLGTATPLIDSKLGNLELADLARALAKGPNGGADANAEAEAETEAAAANGEERGIKRKREEEESNSDAPINGGNGDTGNGNGDGNGHPMDETGDGNGCPMDEAGDGDGGLAARSAQLQAAISGELSAVQQALMEQDRDYLVLKRQQLDQARRLGLIAESSPRCVV